MTFTKPLKNKIVECDGWLIISLRASQILDGADLAHLRERIARVPEQDRVLIGIAIDLTNVLKLPEGFFGMTFDFVERGYKIALDHPCEEFRQYHWFKQFAKSLGNDRYQIQQEFQDRTYYDALRGPDKYQPTTNPLERP